MHALRFACKLHFALLWNCLSSCRWCGMICCCVISNMAAFTFWNWEQATAIKTVFRHGKPYTRAISSNVVTNCKEFNRRAEFCHKIKSFSFVDDTNSSLNQCECRKYIFVQKCYAKFHLVFRRMWHKFPPKQ